MPAQSQAARSRPRASRQSFVPGEGNLEAQQPLVRAGARLGSILVHVRVEASDKRELPAVWVVVHRVDQESVRELKLPGFRVEDGTRDIGRLKEVRV